MHILVALLGVIGIIVTVLWRIKQASEVARSAGEAAKDAQGFFRALAWKRKAGKDVLSTIEDPREAASVMLITIAQYPGAITDAEIKTIRASMVDTFDASISQANELIAHGQWLTKDAGDIGNLFTKLSPVIERGCGPNERRDLIRMLRKTAKHRAESSDVPNQEIDRLERRLLPR